MPADSPLTPRAGVTDIVATSDAIINSLVAPPLPAARVCPLCHTWKPDHLPTCESCERTGRAVGFPAGPISVITLTTKPSDLRDWLTRYKGRSGDDDPFEQESWDRIRALLGRYLMDHGADLLECTGPVDRVVTVPSGQDRPIPHPLEAILASLQFDVPVDRPLSRGPGLLGFNRSAIDGYICRPGDTGCRVLLVEDVFVTGARVFSAARAMQDAGHTVAGVLVLARRVNREWGDAESLWDDQATSAFAWTNSPRTAAPDEALLTRLRTLSVGV